MKLATIFIGLAFMVVASFSNADDGQWQNLFDGKSLDGWNAEDHDECFKVQDEAIVAGGGPLARLSYVGPINKHDFRNFELKVEVMAKPLAIASPSPTKSMTASAPRPPVRASTAATSFPSAFTR